jgi:leucyl aminopeptidase (aminopeptidase T)
MPGITEEVILRTFGADYGSIRKRVNSLCDRLDETDEIHVTTELGTDLLMEVKGRKGRGRRGGIYDENGAWGNLPCGEAFIAPVEGTCRGTYVVDAAQAGLANLSTPITVVVEQGRSVDFKGGEEAELLAELLRHIGNDEAFNIAELGIGCNDRAAISSVTLEAEKALGTCHIGIGSNCHFGGKVDVTVHLDGVIRTPTIYFDGEKILDGGSLTINT